MTNGLAVHNLDTWCPLKAGVASVWNVNAAVAGKLALPAEPAQTGPLTRNSKGI